VGTVTQNQETVLREVMRDIGQTIEETSGHSDTVPPEGTV